MQVFIWSECQIRFRHCFMHLDKVLLMYITHDAWIVEEFAFNSWKIAPSTWYFSYITLMVFMIAELQQDKMLKGRQNMLFAREYSSWNKSSPCFFSSIPLLPFAYVWHISPYWKLCVDDAFNQAVFFMANSILQRTSYIMSFLLLIY